MEKPIFTPSEIRVNYKNWRDELVSRLAEGINKERTGTRWPQVTKASLAKRINLNPFLSKSNKDGELELLIKECEVKGNYKKFWWVVNNKQTK